MTDLNVASKEVLAKLMATENISVVHANAKTASFDIKDRVLTLPMWENMVKETYDHLVGHEVGHALFTPSDDWMQAVETKGEGYRTFLNVVEDARIEKLIQRRFPGLRKSFVKSYRKMLSEGFFGKDEKELNESQLIDRLNVYFKCGSSLGINFSSEEKSWIKEIDNAETFEDVVDIANRLYNEAVDEEQRNTDAFQEMIMQMQSEDGETSDGEEEESDDEDGEAQLQSGDDNDDWEDAELDEEDEDGDYVISNDLQGTPEEIKGPYSETDRNLSQNIADNYSDNSELEIRTARLSTSPLDIFTIGYDSIIRDYEANYTECIFAGDELHKKFMSNNKKTINYMVKEFEMRKSALAYSRAQISKTGVIDTVKMNNYKFADDIFRKVTVLPDGKNHGMIMIVDWSGSMADDIFNTVEQLLNLTMFCRQVNIPFEVYSFNDRGTYKSEEDVIAYRKYLNTVDVNDLVYSKNFRLVQLFDSKMNNQKFSKMAKILLGVSNYFKKAVYYRISPNMQLGGTPLAETVMASIEIYKNFKNKYRCDIVNTILLTDGAGDYIDVCTDKDESRYSGPITKNAQHFAPSRYHGYGGSGKESLQRLFIQDPVTKITKPVLNSLEMTNALIKMFRAVTGEKMIGYRILPSRKNSFISDYSDYQRRKTYQEASTAWEKVKTEKWIEITGYGYDMFFGILGGKNLETSNGAITVADDASIAKIRTAFKKSQSGKNQSRAMLNKFIEIIS